MPDRAAPTRFPELAEADELLLDEAYLRILELLERGDTPRIESLCDGRPDLAPRVGSLLRLARSVSPILDPDVPPPTLPGYELLSRIGSGGMGVVYLCRQLSMGGRLVAVKVLKDSLESSARRLELIRAEALALARLRHPGVVDVYEFIQGHERAPEGDHAGTRPVHAFAMQWVQGRSLADFLARLADRCPGRAPEAADIAALLPGANLGGAGASHVFCRMLAGVARTLHAVHAAGLLHRDIKPSNVLVRDDGGAMLTDFGLAREHSDQPEKAGRFSGTRAFASPEQARGEPLTPRSDVFSLGMTLRQAVSLHPEAHAPITRPAQTFPRDLAAIITKATAASPSDRYATAAELAQDLERFLDDRPVRARPPSPWDRAARLVRRQRRAVIGTTLGAAAALLLAGAVVLAVFIAPRRAEEHLTRARLELLSPGHANALWNIEWFGQAPGSAHSRFALDPAALSRALAQYRAALRWQPWGRLNGEIASEMRIVESAGGDAPSGRRAGGQLESEGDRLAGLGAYLAGDAVRAIEAWTRFAAREDPDAFIDAALGILHLVREEPALAYPRLEHARMAFPEVGFLAVYHADAAVGCGDLDRAERLLADAGRLGNQDRLLAAKRVSADLLFARGHWDAALAEFRTITLNSPMVEVRIARVLAAKGDTNEAVTTLGRVLAAGRRPARVHSEYVHMVVKWWGELDGTGRLTTIRLAVSLGPNNPSSLAFRLRYALLSAQPFERPPNTPSGSWQTSVLLDLVALLKPDSHASLEQATLVELARRMEVANMNRWTQMMSYAQPLRNLQLLAWSCPFARSASEVLQLIHRRTHKSRAAVVVASLASIASGQATFTPLGDLPGGVFYSEAGSISADGSTIVGTSETGNGTETFVWRNGVMTSLADLPGGAVFSVPTACSADGRVVVGLSVNGTGYRRAVRWVNGGPPEELGMLPGYGGYSYARSVSADGRTITGECGDASHNSSSTVQAYRWHEGVLTGLPFFAGSEADTTGNAVSADGNTIAGRVRRFGSDYQACVWGPSGAQLLPDGGGVSAVYSGCSADGSVLAGFAGPSTSVYGAARWVNGAFQYIGNLPGDNQTILSASNADGNIHVGFSLSNGRAVMWKASTGLVALQNELTQTYALDLSGWTLQFAAGISADGLAIVGTGINPAGHSEAWLVRLPPACTAPGSTGLPAPTAVSVGKPAAFSAGAPSGTPPFTYQWRKDGVNLTDGGAVFGSALPVLTILSASAADAGAYDVIITNACGSVTSDPADLRVVCNADYNADGNIDPDDLGDFITAYFLQVDTGTCP